MPTKKTAIKDFRQRLTQIVHEELQLALKEDVNVHLKRVRDKDKFVAWIMRQYFNPEKHGKQIWYNPSVNEDNVLEYISKIKNHFPLSPKEVADLWRLKKSLSSSMNVIDKELEEIPDEEEEKPEKGTYQTGEVSLKDIGQELGGLTPTMINKLAASGMEKIRKLSGGTAPWDMESDQWEALLAAIKSARSDTATEYAEALKGSAGNIRGFLQSLAKQQILTPSDLNLIRDEEVEGLAILYTKPAEQIRNILLQDIEGDNNIFKSFQSAVSKKIFPPGKRGRPKKQED
jgi:hypothetical protein